MTTALTAAALVGIGGSLGAVARHAVGLRVAERRSLLLVNTVGSLALGGILAAPLAQTATLLFGVGFCGAFTTFSSLAVGTVRSAGRDGVRSGAVLAGSTLVAALAGFLLGSLLVGRLVG